MSRSSVIRELKTYHDRHRQDRYYQETHAFTGAGAFRLLVCALEVDNAPFDVLVGLLDVVVDSVD